ncbi:MAG: heavy metal translocating P-type ATPase, partial [Gammaproteobacteria bacterium]|nr:heavy metal translocating P-type ATPase [Gammaproteobacteria bacterium]
MVDQPASQENCFHCGLDIPTGIDIHVDINDRPQAMCCEGCAAVSNAIVSAGLTSYYKNRTADAMQGEALVPDELRELAVYNHPKIQQSFVHTSEGQAGEHIKEAALILEGITCAACVWLNEQHLRKQPGVLGVEVNYTTQRATVKWDDAQIQLGDILEVIRLIGYTAHPYDTSRRQQIIENQRRDTLKRL